MTYTTAEEWAKKFVCTGQEPRTQYEASLVMRLTSLIKQVQEAKRDRCGQIAQELDGASGGYIAKAFRSIGDDK